MADLSEYSGDSFEVTCVCGGRFRITGRDLLRHVACQACSRALIPVPAVNLNGSAAGVSGGRAIDSDDETPVYALNVSQWDNFWRYLTCLAVGAISGAAFLVPVLKPNALAIVFCVALLDFISIVFIFLGAFTSRCFIYPTRVETEVGIFSRQKQSLAMARITELQLQQNFIGRLLGIGTIIIKAGPAKADEATEQEMQLFQIPRVGKVYKFLRKHAPKAG